MTWGPYVTKDYVPFRSLCVFLDAVGLNGVPSPVLTSLRRSVIDMSAAFATCNIGVDLSCCMSCNLTLFVHEYGLSRLLDNTRVVL